LNDTNASTRLSRLRQTYWAEQVLQPARLSDFHTAIFKAQSHHTIMRAAMLGLTSLFDKQAKTQRRNGRELIYPPPLPFTRLHYRITIAPPFSKLRSAFGLLDLRRESIKPSEEGERE